MVEMVLFIAGIVIGLAGGIALMHSRIDELELRLRQQKQISDARASLLGWSRRTLS